MIIIAAVLLGAFLGVRNARKRGGTRVDIAQYAVVYAIAFGIVGMLATVLIHRYSV